MPPGGDRMSKKFLILSCTYNNSKDHDGTKIYQIFIAAVRKIFIFDHELTKYSQLN